MSTSKTRLPPKRRKALAAGLARVIDAVDFPDFVAALVEGTFQAIVDGTIRQMKAYEQLIKDVASSVDAFGKDTVSADAARDRLINKYGLRLGTDWPPKSKRAGAKKARARSLSRNRQQLLATMVLMGINRIVVTDGRIGAKLRRVAEDSPTTTKTKPAGKVKDRMRAK